MKTIFSSIALLAFAAASASAASFPDLQEFMGRLKEQPAVATPAAAPVDDALIVLVKGAPAPQGRECDLIDGPVGICTYRCYAYGEIVTRPADRTIPPGRGAHQRPYCYVRIVL